MSDRWPRAVVADLGARTEARLRRLADAHPAFARAKPAWRALRRIRGNSAASRTAAGGQLRLEITPEPQPGVNVVGYFRAELGIAEVARKLVRGLEHAGLAHTTIPYGRTVSRQEHPFAAKAPSTAPYDTNLICVNADLLATFRADVGPEFFAKRRSIGVWFWEVARFPPTLHHAFDLVDEVWVASSFVRDSLAGETSKPVHVVPLPVEAPAATTRARPELGLPNGFLFLFSFDFLSIFERKNPLALVEAYIQAFTPGDGAVLVLKSINGDQDPRSLARLREAASGRSDIQVLDGYVSAEDNEAVIAACDCYVSLHRSEGYGLTMAEAMAHGKPVIATRYSGNLEFMTEENSYLLSYRLTPVPPGCDPYPAGADWADADVDAAAALMRYVFENYEEAASRGRRARDVVLGRFTLDRTAAFMYERLDGERASRPLPMA